MSDPILSVHHLSIDYGYEEDATHAVTDVSFTLGRGEFLGLAGESGCGKSTLAYGIANILRNPANIVSGEILYYGKNTPPTNILALSGAALRAFRWNELAIVFQSAMNALNPVLSLRAQFRDIFTTHRPHMSRKDIDQRAVELLQMVGIAPDRLHSFPHELSGGMRQRAGIALALALNPDIIIMDEPTTALDVVAQREILSEMIRLRQNLQFSVIFITHDLSLLLELADNVAIMYAGRIVEYGDRRNLYTHARHPYSYGLLHSFPPLRGPAKKVFGIAGSPPDLRALPQGCAFHPRCPMAFAACQSALPILKTADPAFPAQQTACHLYDTALRATPPTEEDIAAAYAANSQRRGMRV